MDSSYLYQCARCGATFREPELSVKQFCDDCGRHWVRKRSWERRTAEIQEMFLAYDHTALYFQRLLLLMIPDDRVQDIAA